MKFILIFLFLSHPAFALMDMDFLSFGDKDFSEEKTTKSKWFVKTGLEYIKYRSTFPEYDGQHESINEHEDEDIFGYGLYFGRDLYMGKGISTAISFGAFYSKTLNKEVGKAAEDIDIDIAQTRRGHQILQYEGTLSLNYLFDNEVVDVQPFIETSVGIGTAKVEKRYSREPVEGAQYSEDYDVTTEEEYVFSKISLGVNLIAFNGIASYFKVSTMIMNISDRETVGDSNAYGTTTIVEYDDKEKDLNENVTMTMASLGLGYMF